ncbi:MAG: pilin [Candidatus Gracilibacteria bacterium]|nr:hypothetical protein [Candidatus Gracilibacteria bacterium]
MKKTTSALILGTFLLFSSSFLVVSAQSAQDSINSAKSLIPEEGSLSKDLGPGEMLDCIKFMKLPTLKKNVVENTEFSVDGISLASNGAKQSKSVNITNPRDAALTCGIKSGRIPLWLIPFYIVRVINFLLVFSGLVSTLFMVIGGYHMIIGSYSEEKEKGKNAFKYALFGLVITLLAYTMVNLVLLFVSS